MYSVTLMILCDDNDVNHGDVNEDAEVVEALRRMQRCSMRKMTEA